MDDSAISVSRRGCASNSYALSGKIMLASVVTLFTVVVIMICFHTYARWFFIRARNRHQHRRVHLVFPNSSLPFRGLDVSLLKSLPTFVYSSATTHQHPLECAVCLSEFEENERGRLLPKCNHSFHIDCIDMWFHSHSNCPLCRAPVKPVVPATEIPVETVVSIFEPAGKEAESSSGPCSSCQREEDETGCSSSSPPLGCRKKSLELVGISVDVPTRNQSFRGFEEPDFGSPGGHGCKSPGGRILSLKRILSI